MILIKSRWAVYPYLQVAVSVRRCWNMTTAAELFVFLREERALVFRNVYYYFYFYTWGGWYEVEQYRKYTKFTQGYHVDFDYTCCPVEPCALNFSYCQR